MVRRALSRPDELARVAAELVEQGRVDGADLDLDDPLGFLVHEGGAASVVEAAYRFARHEPGCHVVLTGTGSVEHLEENVRSINAPPLPDARPRPAPYPVRTSRPSLGQLRRSSVPMRYQLSLDQIPTAWFNVLPVMPEPLQPPLHPATKEPVGPDDLAPLFPMGLIAQEVSTEPWIDIPGEVLDILRLWRPTPLVRAERLERALGTPARIYFKDESVSPAGSHKPNTAVPQAFYNKAEGITRLTTETGAGQWGSALVVRVRAVRPRVQGVHGARLVRAEAVPQDPDGDVGRRGGAVTGRPTRSSRFARPRDQRRGARRGDPRRHALLARARC